MQQEGRGLREIAELIGCHASTVSRALQTQHQEEEAA
ncbi:helix-turn-helix domain-containing protein [Bradyrhizobium sp. AZCC 2289]